MDKKNQIFVNLKYGISMLIDRKAFIRYWCLYTIIGTTLPFLTALFPSCIVSAAKSESPISAIEAMVVLLVILLAQTAITYMEKENNKQLLLSRINLLNPMMDKYMKLPVAWCISKEGQETLAKARRNAFEGNYIGMEAFLSQFPNITVNFLCMFIEFVVLAKYSIFFSVAVMVSGVFVSAVSAWAGKKDDIYQDKLGEIYGKQRDLQEAILEESGRKDIYMFSLRGILIRRLYKYTSLARIFQKKSETCYEISDDAGNVMAALRDIFIYVILINKVMSGSITTEDFIFVVGIIEIFEQWLQDFFENIRDIIKNSIIMSDFRKLIDAPCEETLLNREYQSEKEIIGHEIVFDHVWFKYPGEKKYVIKDMSLKIDAGEKVALVGLNGAGKSTFVELLLGTLIPDKGKILLDGIDIQSISRNEYIHKFTVVFQNIFVMAASIAENISGVPLGNEDNEKLDKVLSDSMLIKKINDFPNGRKTELTDKLSDDGVVMSGGQMQRLALARAMYRRGDIIVLDEPTSALDPLAEEKLYHSYEKDTNGRSGIFISHRLISTKFCDRILFLKDGKIEESGSHEELMRCKGEYYKLFCLQADKYKKAGEV